MRYIVHGTDATTGREVTLGVDEPRATEAVHAALGKRILVSSVTRGLWVRLQATLLPAFAVVLVLAVVVLGILMADNNRLRRETSVATAASGKLTSELNGHASALMEARQKIATLEAASTDHARALVKEIETLRQTAAARDGEAKGLRQQLEEARAAASSNAATLQQQLAEMKKTLEQREGAVKKLEGQVKQGKATAKELEAARASLNEMQTSMAASQTRAEKLNVANRELMKQVDLLKAQLLEAAAREEKDVPPMPKVMRWPLPTTYDAAADFMNLHFKNKTAVAAADDPKVLTITALNPDIGGQLVLVTDKERVYGVTLMISLAPDAPKEMLAANQKLAGEFLRLAASHVKDPGMVLAEATALLQNKPATQRLQYAGETAAVTVFNNKMGLFTFSAQPAQH